MMAMISLAIIDDHPLFREGVIRSLCEIGEFEVVGEGDTAEAALRIAAERQPDIVLMDISMPGGGIDAIVPMLKQNPEQKIVMLTASEASDDITAAIRSGAKGYVLKGVGSRTLADILRSVAAGESYVSPTLTARVLSALDGSQANANGIADLNPRESEILALVTSGLSNKRAALKLGLHEKTIKHYMTRIMAKLGVSNRTEAAMAFRDAKDIRRR